MGGNTGFGEMSAEAFLVCFFISSSFGVGFDAASGDSSKKGLVSAGVTATLLIPPSAVTEGAVVGAAVGVGGGGLLGRVPGFGGGPGGGMFGFFIDSSRAGAGGVSKGLASGLAGLLGVVRGGGGADFFFRSVAGLCRESELAVL